MTAPLAFITGASSGIGQALAAEYARQGWRLALVARRAEVLQQWAQREGLDATRCGIYPADVSQIDAAVAAGQQCIAQQGLPDVVIANAGISVGVDTAVRADLDVMDEVLRLNTLAPAATFHPFIAPMRARGHGTLVGVASVAAIRGLPGHGAYCASKAGVLAYCESLRGELRGSGVRVVTLIPGYIDTPLTQGNRYSMPFLMPAEAFARAAVATIAAGRRRRTIPWPMGVVAGVMRCLPGALYDRLVAGRGRKARRSEG